MILLDRATWLILGGLTSLLFCPSQGVPDTGVSCPIWFVPNSTGDGCECGSSIGGYLICDEKSASVYLKECYCITHGKEQSKYILSHCLFTCHVTLGDSTYNALLSEDLDNFTCGPYNRTGMMCGECMEGHAPPVYSYVYSCVPCRNEHSNWLKYVAVAYLPLTGFFILIVILKISVNSAPMIAYVTLCQLIAAPTLMHYDFYGYSHGARETYKRVVGSFYAIWNLDFFRGLYHPFCLHPDYSILFVASLDYLVGVYPLFLIFITCCLVWLHDRYVVISRLWRPFYSLCSLFRREWNLRESLVKVYATFMLLSYVKIMNVSFVILTKSGTYYNAHGQGLKSSYVYANGSLPYFSSQHLPYAICAIFMLLVFNLLPLLLLCLYPTSCFHKCLNLKICRCQALHTFMDTMQGCYREKPFDCRYFAGFYVFLRCVNLTLRALPGVPYHHLYSVCTSGVTILLLAIFRPYKKASHNTIDITLFCVDVLWHVTRIMYINSFTAYPTTLNYPFMVFFYTMFTIFPLFGVCLMLYQIRRLASKLLPSRYVRQFSLLKKEEKIEDPDFIVSRNECLSLIH